MNTPVEDIKIIDGVKIRNKSRWQVEIEASIKETERMKHAGSNNQSKY